MDAAIGSLTGLVAVLCIFGIPGLWILSRTDIGRAITDRIRHGPNAALDQELLAEFEAMRDQLGEMQDRLEFAERTLAALKPGAPADGRTGG